MKSRACCSRAASLLARFARKASFSARSFWVSLLLLMAAASADGAACTFWEAAACRRSVRSLASSSRSPSSSLCKLTARASASPECRFDSQYWTEFTPTAIRSDAATAQLAQDGTPRREGVSVASTRGSTPSRSRVRSTVAVPGNSLSSLCFAFSRSLASCSVKSAAS